MKKLIILAVAFVCSVASWAQPMAVQQPGSRRALPELHLKAGTRTAQHRVAAQGRTTKVVMADGIRQRKALKTIADADASLFSGRTVYGAMVNSDLWANMSITEVPYGIYSFELNSTEAPKAHIADMTYNFMSGAWGRDRHYGIVPLSILGAINGARYITINTRDWKETRNVMWDPSYGTYSLVASTMAYDPTSDDFYAFQYKEDLSGLNWVKLNQQTDQMEQVAQYRGTVSVLTLAATPDGQMYYIDAAGDLYTVNKQNCRASLVGNTGVEPSAYNQSMVYDGKSGTFLWAAQSSEGSVLYSVNPQTAETKRVMRFLHNEQFISLYITDTEAPAGAPAAVGRPQLRMDSNGSLTGNIAFNVPSRTYDGATLEGNVNLNVWMDGENIKGEEVAAGTSMTIPFTATEGNHYVAITTDNAAGFSPLRYIYQYIGYDTPLAATNVEFAQADGTNTVTWKAPEAGVNGGYIDTQSLTYDIVRMPDSVTVATGLTATTFSEPTPTAMHNYSYRVIADNNGHKAQWTESNRVLCGSSFTVPYEQLFADPTTLSEYFTVVDNDGDGNTWRQGYTTEVRLDYYNKTVDADDWLISPPITMQTGTKYRFTMNMKIFTQNYPEDFEVLIGTDKTDLQSFRVVKREEGFTRIANEFGDYTTDFLVETTGDYYMAVRYCSKKDSQGSLMMLHNIAVTAVGNSQAPAQPADFAITPDAGDLLKATVTMKAPTLNLMEETLTSLTSVELYRDDVAEPVHIFNAPQPGDVLSFTDENVPTVGLHTYTAVASNAEGRGEPVTAEQFIGIYTPPYTEDFENRKLSELWTHQYSYNDDLNNWWGWKWTENDNTYGRFMNLYYYLQENTPTDIWLFSPRMKLAADAVYTVAFDGQMGVSYYPDMSYDLYQGTEPSKDGMSTLVANIPPTEYQMLHQEYRLVNSAAGRYHLGIRAQGAKANDYFSANLDNFSVTYRTSAFAPFEMTAFEAKADASAQLKTDIAFNAPTVNYYDEPLNADEPLTIKIYRGQNATMPAHTLTAKPGERVEWTDAQALHGLNYYTVTCENQYGRGEAIYDTLFVGRDVPALVENYAARGTADNKDAVISWSTPQEGANGGVVLPEETTYNVYSYDPATGDLTPIVEGVTGNSYTVERSEQTPQQLYYYAVSAKNSEGEGQALVTSVVLGQVYELPFRESFAQQTLSTQLWQAIPMVQGATSTGIDNPTGGSYNQCTGPQDNDGGCAYFYNGYQYEVQAGALLIAPKVKLSSEKGNELRFWAYHFKEVYSSPAFVQVAVSADDSQFSNIPNALIKVGGNAENGWQEHVVKLDSYRNSDFVSVALLGITSGYQDVIYVDNFSIENPSAAGISDMQAGEQAGEQKFFDLQGRPIANPAAYSGIMIQHNKKVVKK